MSNSHNANNFTSNATSAGSINLAYSGKTPHDSKKIWTSFHANLPVEL